ncbi:MAG: hypothetical protein CMJ49_01165 [Planctomycetaceae bacterium]|nr:hypothetical protein [Planctomycetaceae bacterium]
MTFWIIFGCVVAFMAAVAVLAVVFSRRTIRIAGEAIEERGGTIQGKCEILNFDESGRPQGNRVAVEYTLPSGEWFRAEIEVRRGRANFIEDVPIDVWFGRKYDQRDQDQNKDEDEDQAPNDSIDLDDFMLGADKLDYQVGAASELLDQSCERLARTETQLIEFHEDQMSPTAKDAAGEHATFPALLQQVRLRVPTVTPADSAVLELVVHGKDVDIGWHCEGKMPLRRLVIQSIDAQPPTDDAASASP